MALNGAVERRLVSGAPAITLPQALGIDPGACARACAFFVSAPLGECEARHLPGARRLKAASHTFSVVLRSFGPFSGLHERSSDTCRPPSRPQWRRPRIPVSLAGRATICAVFLDPVP